MDFQNKYTQALLALALEGAEPEHDLRVLRADGVRVRVMAFDLKALDVEAPTLVITGREGEQPAVWTGPWHEAFMMLRLRARTLESGTRASVVMPEALAIQNFLGEVKDARARARDERDEAARLKALASVDPEIGF